MSMLLGDRMGRMTISSQMMRGILDSIAARLDEARDMARYMTGLLVFLGLLGTFWGLIETVGSVGNVINTLQARRRRRLALRRPQGGACRAAAAAWASRSRRRCSASPARWCSAFSTCRPSQAQNRFYTELEDWLSTTVRDLGVERRDAAAAPAAAAMSARSKTAIERLREAITDSGSNRATTTAMANLAEAIQGLVHHMRTEQQMIRDWVDSQAEQHREIRRLLEDSRARRREQVGRPGRTPQWPSHAPAATAA